MLFKKKYDDKEIECNYCHYKGKPIIEKNKLGIPGGLTPGPLFGRVNCSYANKPYKFILICPKCKAIIGAKK